MNFFIVGSSDKTEDCKKMPSSRGDCLQPLGVFASVHIAAKGEEKDTIQRRNKC